jgi:hypothetical protein
MSRDQSFAVLSCGLTLRFHESVTICKSSGTASEKENRMTYDDLPISKKTASGVVGVAAILFYLWLLTWAAPVKAMGLVAAPADAAPTVTEARIYKRGRTPVYPYVAKGPGPRGWSSYFGFVPYTKGQVENEAIQRNFYPMDSWPHDPNAPIPQPYGLGN